MRLAIHSDEGEVTRVEVSGEVVHLGAADGKNPLDELLGSGCYQGKVLLDMHSVDRIDSSGVGWLLRSHTEFRTQGGKLVIHSVSPFARDVLKVLNLHRVLHMAEDEEAALEIVQGGQ